ncbi:MAG TPA: HAD-IC family P-type ATPase, partial [Candidatus Bathyarchaeia archaeon]|nr:HAD-IC family P-type ATPase [Candidatus Bathyarchaeia archaeon]
MVKQKKQQDSGLSSAEALKRLKQYGPNEIEGKKGLPWFKLVFDQFKSPLIYILFFAGVITLVLKEWTDASVIFLAVAVNTVLGFIQEFKAEKSLVALRKMLVLHALVLRGGKEEKIEANQIVPGDLVILKTGGRVPCDGVVVEQMDLHLNEAILTGESVAVRKKKQEEVFMGTVVVGGRAKILATKTGMETKMGKLAGKLKETIDEETPLKKEIGKLSKILAIVFSVICVIIFFEGMWRQRYWLEMFTLSTAVAVAAIPEGLVISLTVILTLGMQRVLQRKGLVRKLLAAETLGSVDVICADKTGTLTEGKMRVVGADMVDKQLGIRAAVLCNNMINPLEISMMQWAKKMQNVKRKMQTSELINKYKRLDEIPFSSERKFIATLHEGNGDKGEIFLSGAPEMVMEISQLPKTEKEKWQKKLEDYTKKGLRVVAFAYRTCDSRQIKEAFRKLKKDFGKYDGKVDGNYDFVQLKWLGLMLFEDPVRIEVKQALAACRRAGIKVKVITGDYKNTAVNVLKKLDLTGDGFGKDSIMEGWELEKISDEQLTQKIENVILFCRTTPEQKIRIVKALQVKGHTVAMMGDGVNDALALKKSDIGIVVGSASEVAKETADMVLLDSNFKTIVAAVGEGRGIFENIKKVVLYLLSDSFTEVILIGGSLLFGLPTPLLPAQILWINLVEDGLPGLALAFEPKDEGLMNEIPRKKGTPILDKEIKILIFIIGLTTDLLLFGIF